MLTNAKFSMLFYILSLGVAFFSRKIFLDSLGTNFVGLSTTLQNILGFLNLAEMGIGVAIGFSLYKPLYEQNREEITEIITVLGYFYRWIGIIILAIGLILAFFLPFIIPESQFNPGVVLTIYTVFLFSSLLSYFVNYKQVLLCADQKNYLVVSSLQGVNILKSLLQMSAALLWANYYLWAALEMTGGILLSIILHRIIKRHYPWLNTHLKQGRQMLRGYSYITKTCKQVFFHRIGCFAEWQVMPVLIYSVEASLSIVALYGNYVLLTDKALGCINQIYQSTQASIGNLVAEGNIQKIQYVFQEILSLRLFLGGLTSCSFYFLSDEFITCWLGTEYQLGNSVVLLLAVRLIFTQSSSTSTDFGMAFGLFWDIWAPFVQLGILFAVSIPLGIRLGLTGVLLGNLVSYTLVYVIWKSILVHHWGIKQPVSVYFLRLLFFWGVIGICGITTHNLTDYFLAPFVFESLWLHFLIKAALYGCLLLTTMAFAFFIISSHFRTAVFKLARNLHICY